jgi:hypothetical protein
MEDQNKPVKIVLSGKVQFDDQITVNQAAQILAFLDSTSNAATPHLVTAAQQPMRLGSSAASKSPREALESSGAKTNPEKIVALALHVLQEGEKDTFSLEDIKPLFRRARESAPRNITRDLDSAVKAGWICESDVKGEFYVEQKASSVLEETFEPLRGRRSSTGKTAATSRTAPTRKPRKTSMATPEAFKDAEITPTMDGFPDFHKLRTKTDKFLWTVVKAQSLGAPSVSNKEVVWLSDKLGDGIASNDVAANYRSNYKASYVNRSTQDDKIRVLPKGITYLQSKTEA